MAFINWGEIDSLGEVAELVAVIGIAASSIIAWLLLRVEKVKVKARKDDVANHAQTIKNYQETIDSWEKRFSSIEQESKQCAENYSKATNEIAALTGKVAILETLPLKDINSNIAKIMQTQTDTLQALKSYIDSDDKVQKHIESALVRLLEEK